MKLFSLLLLFAACHTIAQVGINTTAPSAAWGLPVVGAFMYTSNDNPPQKHPYNCSGPKTAVIVYAMKLWAQRPIPFP